MVFDPDKFLEENSQPLKKGEGFDPDKFLEKSAGANLAVPSKQPKKVPPSFGEKAYGAAYGLGYGTLAGTLGLPSDIERGAREIAGVLPSPWLSEKQKQKMAQSLKGPTFFPTSEKLKEQLAVAGVRRPQNVKGYELAGELAPGIYGLGALGARGISALSKKAGELYREARGVPLRESAEQVRETISREAATRGAKSEAEAARAAAEQRHYEQSAQRAAAGRETAEARVAERQIRQPGEPVSGRFVPERVPEISARQQVLADLRRAESAAVSEKTVATRAREAAQESAEKVAESLAQMPGMSPEQFVQIARQSASALENNLIEAREVGAKFPEALKAAGSALKVNTSKALKRLALTRKSLRNPQFDTAAKYLEQALINPPKKKGAQSIKALSISQAESLRKTIDKAITTGFLGESAIGKEAAANLNPIRKILVETAKKADKGYKNALAKFSELSRPLDIFSSGELGKITATLDRTQAGYAAREAEVVGHLLNRGGDSARMIERLQYENPEIRNAVKLYFSRQLFGEGKTPTVKEMRTFLMKNEAVLTKLGLLKEFADIRSSLKTASDAVKSAAAAEEVASAAASRLGSMVKKQKARLEKILGTVTPVEDLVARGTRIGEAEKKLRARATTAEAKSAAAAKKATAYRVLETELAQPGLEPGQIAQKAETMAKGLAKDGLITQEEYAVFLREIAPIREKIVSSQEAAGKIKTAFSKMLKYGLPAGVAGGGLAEFLRRSF